MIVFALAWSNGYVIVVMIACLTPLAQVSSKWWGKMQFSVENGGLGWGLLWALCSIVVVPRIPQLGVSDQVNKRKHVTGNIWATHTSLELISIFFFVKYVISWSTSWCWSLSWQMLRATLHNLCWWWSEQCWVETTVVTRYPDTQCTLATTPACHTPSVVLWLSTC